METYKALKIIESYRQSLTQAGVVICTAVTEDYEEFDVIDYEWKDTYPQFEVVNCIIIPEEEI